MQPAEFWAFPTFLAVPVMLAPAGVLMAVGLWLALFPPRPNGFAGTRIAWTYADEGIWYATQRVSGWLIGAAGGVLTLWWPAGVAATWAAAVAAIFYARGLYVAKYGTSRTWRPGTGWTHYLPMAGCPNCGHLNRLEGAEELALKRCESCGHSLVR